MILNEYRDSCVRRLERAGVYNPEGEFDRIARAVFSGAVPPLGSTVSDADQARMEAIMVRREQREPLARILGTVTFYDLPIKVRSGVFRPYPETEFLVTSAAAHFPLHGPRRILDLGTGTGCVLLALLHLFPNATGIGVDNNRLAIALAQENMRALNVDDRAAFRLSDWTEGAGEGFDLVVSNPPRVPSGKVSRLLPEMRDHDPVAAFDGGRDGLDYFRLIARDFGRLASPGGVGVFQASDPSLVRQLFERAGHTRTHIEVNYLGIPHSVSVIRS